MRWWKFNAVGALGIVVQTAVLALLVHVVRWHYLLATPLAVEAAVLHNFFWHRRWTWADRRQERAREVGGALLRFHLGNGLVSILGNIVFMRILVGTLLLEPVLANLLSIVFCSVVNYLLADRFVFPSNLVHPGNTGRKGGMTLSKGPRSRTGERRRLC